MVVLFFEKLRRLDDIAIPDAFDSNRSYEEPTQIPSLRTSSL
jgi:hypothetical protein